MKYTPSSKSLAKKTGELHIKMMYNVTTFI